MVVLLIGYYAIVNLILWGMMKYDKQQAKHRGRRIPERRLLALGLIGGAFGGIAAMRTYRHKTKHIAFTLGLPAMAVLHVLLLGIAFGTEWLEILAR